jgi:hypothetical protein
VATDGTWRVRLGQTIAEYTLPQRDLAAQTPRARGRVSAVGSCCVCVRSILWRRVITTGSAHELSGTFERLDHGAAEAVEGSA